MDYTKKIIDRQDDLQEALNNAQQAIDAKDATKAAEYNDEAALIRQEIRTLRQQREIAAQDVDLTTGQTKDAAWKESHPFASIGEQAQAVRAAALNHREDPRLRAVNEAAGMNETTGADGGYAVQQDFMLKAIETAAQTGEITSRCSHLNVSSNANSVRIVSIKETDVSDSILGGVRAYYLEEEAAQITSSKPKLDYIEISLEEMAAMLYVSDLMMQDAALLSSQVMTFVPTALNRLLEEKILNGTGSHCPKGIMKAAALNTVTATATKKEMLNAVDVMAMRTAMLPSSERNAVWIMHPDFKQYLPFMTLTVGTGGQSLFMPAGGLSEAGYDRLLGKPIVYSDQMAAVGTAGDVGYIDFSQYALLEKGGIRGDTSIHFMFDTAQTAFRFLFRNGGAPLIKDKVTIKNSTLQRSPYVILGGRKA